MSREKNRARRRKQQIWTSQALKCCCPSPIGSIIQAIIIYLQLTTSEPLPWIFTGLVLARPSRRFFFNARHTSAMHALHYMHACTTDYAQSRRLPSADGQPARYYHGIMCQKGLDRRESLCADPSVGISKVFYTWYSTLRTTHGCDAAQVVV